MIRLVLALAAVLLLLPASAQAASVTIEKPRGAGKVSVDLSKEAPDVKSRTYVVRGPSGERQQQVTGWSLGSLLAAAGQGEGSFTKLSVAGTDGPPVEIERGDVDGGDTPPVIYEGQQGLHFLRPSRGANDFNEADTLVGQITVSMLTTDLEVVAIAKPRKTRANRPVQFSAAVTNAEAGDRFTYRWRFGDGATETGQRVYHRYRGRGKYEAFVTVYTPGDPAGQSAVVVVEVGKQPKKGPKRPGTGTNDDATAPTYGAADGGGGASGDPGGGSVAPPPASAVPDAPSPAPSRSAPKRPKPVTVSGAEEQIEGTLLADSAAPAKSPATASAVKAARSGRDPEEPFVVPAEAWTGLGALALMLAGARLELRRGGGRPA